ncbi:MAG: lipoate--protein ligase family protein [Nibricoccus sp.]
MRLDLLPTRTGGAAENMATDLLLLQRYPVEENVRFRHYNWHRPAFTFGYSQPLDFVRAQLPADENVEICRRPSGGGMVDHRNDWTYALVIPRAHDLYEACATESYRLVHACIAQTFTTLGQPAALKEPKPDSTANDTAGCGPGVCFTKAEVYDVIHPHTGAKIAGAAQKRSRPGILFQGSIARDAVSPDLDWDKFEESLSTALAQALGMGAESAPWPEFSEDELSALTEQYSTEEWNGRR